MICNNCGRIIANDAANFCEYCGAPVGAKADAIGGNATDYFGDMNYNRYGSSENGQAGYGADYSNSTYKQGGNYAGGPIVRNNLTDILNGTAGTDETEQSMSFAHWMIIMLLPMIPLVGGLVYIVLLFVWAFGKNATKTRKNWARAMLIMFIVAVFYLSYAIAGFMEASGLDVSQLMGGGM